MLRIPTSDGLATLHVDHEEIDLWMDVHRDATPETLTEADKLAESEGCARMHPDEMPAEHRPNGIVRYYLSYLEVTECL